MHPALHPLDSVFVVLPTSPSDWLPIASLLVALVALFVGPWFSWRTARSQVKSSSRQAWLDTVRSKIAQLMLMCSNVHKSVQAKQAPSESLIEEMLLLRLELELYLNPKKPSQQLILEDAMLLYTACKLSGEKAFTNYALLNAKIGEDTQALVKEVWEKIKSGK